MRSLVPARHGALALFVASLALAAPLSAQASPSPFATQVLSYRPGPGAGSLNDPAKALGAPEGAGGGSGSTHVVSLGVGGSLTLGFAAPIFDGPGSDFVVFENAFYAGMSLDVFAEVFFVEVSSNGTDFARFPVSYAGPASSGPFAVFPVGTWSGLGGTTPVWAHGHLHPEIDARDTAVAGGDAFDLADLRGHPLVQAQKLNLARVTHLRLVDVVDGQSRDDKQRVIHDPSTGSADIDAVAVLHFLVNIDLHAPEVTLELTPTRHLRLRLHDRDGLFDLDPRKLHVAIQGADVDFWSFVAICRVVHADAHGCELETLFALPADLPIKVAASAKDLAGRLGSDSVVLH